MAAGIGAALASAGVVVVAARWARLAAAGVGLAARIVSLRAYRR